MTMTWNGVMPAITTPFTNPTSSTRNNNTPPTYTSDARPPATITVNNCPHSLSSAKIPI